MSQLDAPSPDRFPWTAVSEKAAELIARGDIDLIAIAARVGVERTTLFRWRKHPEFAARVESHLAEFREDSRRVGAAVREKRIAILRDLQDRLMTVLTERAQSPLWEGIPGARTGLIVHRVVKRMGRGENEVSIEAYDVDSTLTREVRETLKQIAIETGEWTEKSEQSGGMLIKVEYGDGKDAPIAETAPGPSPGPEGSEAVQRAGVRPALG